MSDEQLKEMSGEELLIAYAAYGRAKAVEYTTLNDVTSETLDSVASALRKYPSALGMVLISNHDLSDRNVGHNMLAAFGPDNTITEIPRRGERSKLVPNEARNSVRAFSYYYDGWCSRQSMLDAVSSAMKTR